MANRSTEQFFNSFHRLPVEIDCNFIVDSSNANGLGLRSLKGPGVANVFMQSVVAPPLTPAMGTARSFAVLGASAVTNTGASVLTGNLGIFPGSAITGFPPGTFTGAEDITNVAAQNAQASALAAYTDLHTRASTVIPTALDGQSLTAGVYSSAGGTFTLASAGAGTLTLTGTATDVFVFQTATTLNTGAGGTPTITLAGGALASNVYWAVGSSATINSGNAGTFQGNVIALTSITDTLGGTVNGSLIALNGAVTLSAASIINSQALASGALGGNPNPGPGLIVVQLQDNYNKYYTGFNQIISPTSGTALKVDNSVLVPGQAYVITTLGNSTAAQWKALGVPAGVTPALGVSFIAANNGGAANVSTSRVMTPATSGSSVSTIELVGDPNLLSSPNPSANQGYGASLILQIRDYAGFPNVPVDGSLISLAMLMGNSSVLVQGG